MDENLRIVSQDENVRIVYIFKPSGIVYNGEIKYNGEYNINLSQKFINKVEKAENLHDLLVAKGIISENEVNEFVEARKVLNKLIGE